MSDFLLKCKYFFIFFTRGSFDVVDGPAEVSPSASITSMPSCLPFPWFGERGREKEVAGERGRERLRSVSSSSLPYLTTTGRDKVRKDGPLSPHAAILLFCLSHLIEVRL